MKQKQNIINDPIRVGKNIKAVRKHRSLNQLQLAEAIFKSQAMISKYECGKIYFTIDVLETLGEALDIPPFDLLGKEITESYWEKKEKRVMASKRKDLVPFQNKSLYLYYMSTGSSAFVEEFMFRVSNISNNELYADFDFSNTEQKFTDKMGEYDGKLVIEHDYCYFYLNNSERNERALITTYNYPLKNKNKPYYLIGFMTSLSHGDIRPCFQKCILSSRCLTKNKQELKKFLKLEFEGEININTDYIKYLKKSSDKAFYDWAKKL